MFDSLTGHSWPNGAEWKRASEAVVTGQDRADNARWLDRRRIRRGERDRPNNDSELGLQLADQLINIISQSAK